MKSRSELRKLIMTALYQISICESNKIPYEKKDILKLLLDEPNDFVTNALNGVLENKKDIDENINKYLKNWTIDRLGKTDQAILRLGTYEILYTDIPGAVAIDEALKLSKRYSDEKVKDMINAVLDNILQNK